MFLLLHPAAQLSWTQFTVHPSTAIGIAALGAAYVWRSRQGRGVEAQETGPTAGQRVSFFGSLLLLFLTLNGPLHDLSDYYLFSAHMVQHLVMTLMVPPLMILGTPGWMLRPLLWNPTVFRIARWSTSIRVCYAVFNLVLAFWHLPPMYNLALAYHPIHIVQHLMFLVASVFMWWPLTSMLPELPRASYPAQMLYCFLLSIPMSVIAIYIVMADAALYPAYASAPRVWGISPMMDQQTGGLIMWIPSGIFFYTVMTVVFFKWVGRGEDDQASAQVDWVPTQ